MMLSIFKFHTSLKNWGTIIFRINSNFKNMAMLCHHKIWPVNAKWLPSQVVNALNDAAISTPINIVVAVNDGVKEVQKKQKFT